MSGHATQPCSLFDISYFLCKVRAVQSQIWLAVSCIPRKFTKQPSLTQLPDGLRVVFMISCSTISFMLLAPFFMVIGVVLYKRPVNCSTSNLVSTLFLMFNLIIITSAYETYYCKFVSMFVEKPAKRFCEIKEKNMNLVGNTGIGF